MTKLPPIKNFSHNKKLQGEVSKIYDRANERGSTMTRRTIALEIQRAEDESSGRNDRNGHRLW